MEKAVNRIGQQIQHWFYNATAKSRKAAPNVTINFKGLFNNAVGGCVLTEAQMYSKMYYSERIKEEVDEEIAAKGLSKREHIAYTAKRLQEAYENETDDVKKKVKLELANAAKEKEEAMTLLQEMLESGGEKEQTPEEYAR